MRSMGPSNDRGTISGPSHAKRTTKRTVPVPASKRGSPSSTEHRGPVPQPFATAQSDLSPNVVQSTISEGTAVASTIDRGAEHSGSAEDYAEWKKYYLKCAEYYQQCETTVRQEAGAEAPVSMPASMPVPSAGPPLRSPPAPVAPSVATPSQAPLPPELAAAVAAAMAGTLPSLATPYAGMLGAGNVPWPGAAAAYAPIPSQPVGAAPGLPSCSGYTGYAGFPQPSPPGISPGSLPLFGQLAAKLSGGACNPGGPVTTNPAAGITDEALANLLMAWYLSGYYTGQYAARQGR